MIRKSVEGIVKHQLMECAKAIREADQLSKPLMRTLWGSRGWGAVRGDWWSDWMLRVGGTVEVGELIVFGVS